MCRGQGRTAGKLSVVRGAGISTPGGSWPPAPALSIASRTAYPNADVIGPGGLGFLTPVVQEQAGWDRMAVGMERCYSPGSLSHTHTHTHTHVQSCRGPRVTHTSGW